MTQPDPSYAKIPTITVGLRPHTLPAPITEDTPPAAVTMLLGTLHALPDGGMRIVFDVTGDPARLRIPAASEPGKADGLWQHTCFEVFIATPGEEAYREFNFSPSEQWAGYAFSRYRERNTVADPSFTPRMQCRVDAGHLMLEVELPASALPSVSTGVSLQVGLAAVIELADGSLDYWAVHHPAAQPDFHHRGGWVLSFDPRMISA